MEVVKKRIKRSRLCEDHRYDPKCRDDLAMHRTRVKDISKWIDDACSVPHASVLLLTGPAGCSKMTTVRVLAAEKNISVIEWITPVDNSQTFTNHRTGLSDTVTMSSKFKDFLHRTGRYASVVIEKSGGKKLILVKDFPPSLITSPDEFREILDYYMCHGIFPIIFICTESTTKRSMDLAYELFTETYRQKHKIIHLSVNPISFTCMTKALRRILQLMNEMSQVYEEMIRDVASESHGDIRKAINDIHLRIGGECKMSLMSNTAKIKRGKGKKKMEKKDSNMEEIGLFHSVGRVLYAKRDDLSLKDKTAAEEKSFSSLFVHDPMEIINQFSHYAKPFVMLAHNNYLDIFSSIDSICEGSDYLSLSDVIMSEWNDRELLLTLGFSVAILGLMESNRNPICKWRPLKGNHWTEDLCAAERNQESAWELFSESYTSKLDLHTDVIPIVTQMWNGQHGGANQTKRCKHGFLPHDHTALLSVLRKMKEEVLVMNLDADNVDNRPDTPVHISDGSE